MTLRWGIVSAGRIANDFATALSALPKNNHRILSVADRVLLDAQKFAQRHNIPNYYEGYYQLSQDPNIEIVYVGTINTCHFEVVMMMLNNDKHVLCEKPLGLNEKQARKMIGLAREKNLFLMEGIWTRCFPVMSEVRQLLDSKVIGDIRHVNVSFGISRSDDDRLRLKELGGGTILDLGVYCLQFQQWAYRGLNPEKIVAVGHLNKEGVDSAASAVFIYPGGKTAVLSTNMTLEFPGEGLIIGTKGTIKVKFPIWCPTEYELNGKLHKIPLIENPGKFNYTNSAGLAYEAEEVRIQIKAGNTESDKLPLEETLILARWMDNLRKQIGVVFDADLE